MMAISSKNKLQAFTKVKLSKKVHAGILRAKSLKTVLVPGFSVRIWAVFYSTLSQMG
jgi:hypothetical protein